LAIRLYLSANYSELFHVRQRLPTIFKRSPMFADRELSPMIANDRQRSPSFLKVG
jgi:hypothetical protein